MEENRSLRCVENVLDMHHTTIIRMVSPYFDNGVAHHSSWIGQEGVYDPKGGTIFVDEVIAKQ